MECASLCQSCPTAQQVAAKETFLRSGHICLWPCCLLGFSSRKRLRERSWRSKAVFENNVRARYGLSPGVCQAPVGKRQGRLSLPCSCERLRLREQLSRNMSKPSVEVAESERNRVAGLLVHPWVRKRNGGMIWSSSRGNQLLAARLACRRRTCIVLSTRRPPRFPHFPDANYPASYLPFSTVVTFSDTQFASTVRGFTGENTMMSFSCI